MTLKDLPIGKTATVTVVGGEGALRQHFLDMGIIPMADVTMVKYAPMGDPIEIRIHSYELTLRLADAAKIEIENIRDAKAAKRNERAKAFPHPGLGEGGKYHEKTDEHPLPEGELLTFALAGNQNCGKGCQHLCQGCRAAKQNGQCGNHALLCHKACDKGCGKSPVSKAKRLKYRCNKSGKYCKNTVFGICHNIQMQIKGL